MNAFEKKLSPAELRVFKQMIRGLDQQTIADKLGLKPRTIKFYVSVIGKKCGATSMRQIVAKHYMRQKSANADSCQSRELLSKAEKRVYDQLVTGVSRKEIANNIFRSEVTVNHHLTNINKKLGASSMLDVVMIHHVGKETLLAEREAA